MNKFDHYNQRILELLSYYLNGHECDITPSQIKNVMHCGVDEKKAYELLLLSYLNVDDREFIELYFGKMLHSLKEEDYTCNAYYQNITFENKKLKNWEIKKSKYKPYELFVCDDFKYENQQMIPQLGYFNKPFYYLAVYYQKRLWMSITPNEINTMKKPIQQAYGKVLTFGLGLGYFAYMCSLKEEVQSVTIIEKDENVIALFKQYILPQFPYLDKIEIIQEDAYEFLDKKMKDNVYQYVFVDIYHDAGDGKDTYLKFKPYENRFKNTMFRYWIMETIQYYLKEEN